MRCGFAIYIFDLIAEIIDGKYVNAKMTGYIMQAETSATRLVYNDDLKYVRRNPGTHYYCMSCYR